MSPPGWPAIVSKSTVWPGIRDRLRLARPEREMDMTAPARTMVQRPYRISLPAGPAAAVEARRHIWKIIHAWNVPIDAYAAALLAGELVANAISSDTGDQDTVQLMISWVDGQLRVEVPDRLRPGPAGGDPLLDAETGAGLTLLVSAWRYLRFRYPPEQDRQGR
jgi:hypothetical protein